MPDTTVEELFHRLPDPSVRAELVGAFQPLAMHLARRYVNRGEELADLRQVAIIGLLNAIDRYDADRGTRFTSFAVPTISGELKRHFRDNSWGMKVSRRLKDLALTYRRASQELAQALGRVPTSSEVAAHLGLPEEDLLEVMALGNAYSPEGLEASGGAARNFESSWGGAETSIDAYDDIDAIRSLLSKMSGLERQVLTLRFEHEMTQSQIATHVGVSQMQVSRTLSRCLDKLRVLLGA